MAKKGKEPNVEVTYYDVANRTTRTEKAAAMSSKYSTKETVNLCMKERKGISFELFFLIFALIFIVLIIIEFFGVYRPYLELEQKEKQLAEEQTKLQQLVDSMQDYDEVRENYRKYNYENFPKDIVNRLDILAFLEKTVFDRGKITSVRIGGTSNTVVLEISEVSRDNLKAMLEDIRTSEDVFNRYSSRTDLEDGEIATITITIVFKDPTD